MARYFLELSYSGTNYCGWQVQPNDVTVQQKIEEALSKLLRHNVDVTGAGRTDTGVHASYYVAHFDTDAAHIVSDPDFMHHLRCVVPRDITVMSCTQVADDAHARFDANLREYRYYITRRKNPFTRPTSWFYTADLNIEAMNTACDALIGEKEFTSFAKLHADTKTDICNVIYARWHVTDDMAAFTIRANRFLRNMVRAIVGSTVDVGAGKVSPESFRAIIEERNRCSAGVSAPAEGLFLSSISYPTEIFTPKASPIFTGMPIFD